MALKRPLTHVKSDLNSIFNEMDTLLQPFLTTRHPEMQEHLNAWYPMIDVIENESELQVKAAVPGYDLGDITVEVDHNTLTLSGDYQKSQESEDPQSRYLLKDMASGKFTRKLQLPYEVAAEQAKAELKDGVLMINLPKMSKTKKLEINISN